MTAYMHRLTAVVLAALAADANQFALTIGESPADVNTFTLRDEGDYAVASSLVKGSFVSTSTADLSALATSKGTDPAAVARAQAAIYL